MVRIERVIFEVQDAAGTRFIDMLIEQRGWLVDKGAMKPLVPQGEDLKSRLARINQIAMATHVQNHRAVQLSPDLHSEKRMAHIYNMLVWIQSSPDLRSDELNIKISRFSLPVESAAGGGTRGTPSKANKKKKAPAHISKRKKGFAAKLLNRALNLSPESQRAFYLYRDRLYQLMVKGLLQEHDVNEFMDFMQKSQADGPTVTNMVYRAKKAVAVPPESIGAALKRPENKPFQQAYNAVPQRGFTSEPLKNLYVEIGGTHYAFRITDTVGYVGTVRHVYPAIELHGTEQGKTRFPQYHIKMHSLDAETLYIDELYYHTEPGTTFSRGDRLSAKQVFQFGFDMGYSNIKLDDASSIRFVMPQISGPPVTYNETDKSFQYINIQSDMPPSTYTSVQLFMTMVNAVKHVMLAIRPTLRVYADAANKVQKTLQLEEKLDVAEKALDADYVRIRGEGDKKLQNAYKAETVKDDTEAAGGAAAAAGGAAAAVPDFRIDKYTITPGAPDRDRRQARTGMEAHGEGGGAAAAAAAAVEGRDTVSAEAKPDALHASFFRLKF